MEREKFKFVKVVKGQGRAAPRPTTPPPPVEHVRCVLPDPVDARVSGTVLQALIKHLLYTRRQIPCPFDELVRQVEAAKQGIADDIANGVQRGRKMGPDLRKTVKFVENVQALLQELPASFAKNHMQNAVIVLGTTPVNPREAYVLRIDSMFMPDPIKDVEKESAAVSRNLIRSLVMSGNDTFHAEILPTKMFLLVQTVPDLIVAGCSPKIRFAPKLKNCKPIVISVGTAIFCDRDEQALDTLINQGIDEDRYLWHQSDQLLQGLPHTEGMAGGGQSY